MTTSPYRLRHSKERYRIFEVDRTGKELKDRDSGKLVSSILTEEVKKGVTDVIVACHGWNTHQENDDSVLFFSILFSKIAANEEFESLIEQRPGTKFQFIGIHWPSAPIRRLVGSRRSKPTKEGLQQVQRALAETDPVAGSKLQSLLNNVESTSDTELKIPHDLNDLPEKVRKDFVEMTRAMEPEDEARIGLEDESFNRALQASTVLESSARLEERESNRASTAVGNVIRVLFGGVEQVLFGRFQERASTVGAIGVHSLLSELQKAASRTTRFHLIGHSLGCHVVSSALIGNPRDGNKLLRKIHSMILLQGAVPHRSFAKGERYRAISSQFRPVAGPIVVTHSQSDNALHFYRKFHGDPLGLAGASDTSPLESTDLELQDRTVSYGFKKGRLYNFKADRYISATEGMFGVDLDGSHNDVFDQEVLHCLFEGCRLELEDDDYRLPRNLPSDYFSNLDKQRGM